MSKTEVNNTKQVQDRDHLANVLIVDRDQQSIRFLLEILARKGIRGTVADNKKAAVDFFDKDDCDLVFSVVQIDQPKDGFELVRKIKTNSPEMPVIMMGQTQERKAQNQQQILDTAVKAISAGC